MTNSAIEHKEDGDFGQHTVTSASPVYYALPVLPPNTPFDIEGIRDLWEKRYFMLLMIGSLLIVSTDGIPEETGAGNPRRSILKSVFVVLLGGIFPGALALHAEKPPVTAEMFAANNGKLNDIAAAKYIIYRDETPLSDIIPPDKWPVTDDKIVGAMTDKLDDLRSKTKHEAPWTWQELDAAFPPKKTKKEKAELAPAWQKIRGVTRTYPFGEDGENGGVGPVRLRQSRGSTQADLRVLGRHLRLLRQLPRRRQRYLE